MTDIKQKNGPNQLFVKFWSLGMNDYEIAKNLGVELNTLRSVKKDLSKPVQNEKSTPLQE